MPKITIQCAGSMVLALDELNEFQGELKHLSEENYQKFKADIQELGYSSPIHVWNNPEDEKWYTLDGHQRLKGLKRMRDEEGFEIPELPCVLVHARDFRQAKKKVLALTSQFGEMTEKGLHDFMVDAELNLDDIAPMVVLPQIDLSAFQEKFFPSETITVSEHERKLSDEMLEEQFIVAIQCKNESEMKSIFSELQSRGLDCKLIT